MLAGNIKVYENIGEGDEDITISEELTFCFVRH